ncbi:MAG: sugar phosphate isomerase/epimerase [Candidatus Poribacteria bacterium]|nr:sugar phosphate isomerase/epimerase [Candidatus Poribacteria bacterium]
MKKGICVGTLPGGLSDEGFALAKEAGFEGVELNTLNDDETRQKAAALAKKHEIIVPSIMNSAHWGKPLSDPDPAVRRESVEGMLASFASAEATEAKTVLLVPAVVNDNVTYEQAWIRSQAEILELLKVAEDKKIEIALENVWNRFMLSPTDFAHYVDQFNSEFVTAYFDVGNIALYGIPHHWIRSLGSRITKVHVKGFDTGARQFTSTLLGGNINWNAAMTALNDIGYDGWITAEMPQNRENPRQGCFDLSGEMDKIIGGTV